MRTPTRHALSILAVAALLGACSKPADVAPPVAVAPKAPAVVDPVETGIACYIPGESLDSLIERADSAMYRAKEKGRNRVEIADA